MGYELARGITIHSRKPHSNTQTATLFGIPTQQERKKIERAEVAKFTCAFGLRHLSSERKEERAARLSWY
jgi:hypothetical protein